MAPGMHTRPPSTLHAHTVPAGPHKLHMKLRQHLEWSHWRSHRLRWHAGCTRLRASKHEWRGQSWNGTDLWCPEQRASHLPWLHRISAAEGPTELISVLAALTARTRLAGVAETDAGAQHILSTDLAEPSTANSNSTTTATDRSPLLSPLILSACLQRLAEYRLSEEGLFTSHIATLPEYPDVVFMLQSQLAMLCALQPTAAAAEPQPETAQPNAPPPWAHISLKRMADMLWALDTLLTPWTDSATLEASPAPLAETGLEGILQHSQQHLHPQQSQHPEQQQQSPQQQDQDSDQCVLLGQVLEGVNTWAGAHGSAGAAAQVQQSEPADLTSLLCAYGSLCAHARQHGVPHDPSAALVDPVCGALAEHLRTVETGREMQACDLADVAMALASVHHKSGPVAQLVEAVAHEVYRQINNRNSLNTPFTPDDLIKLLKAYAALKLEDATVSRMLDAIAGYTIKRIRARHVTAISRPADIATMLHAYADLEHSSVAIPELVTWTATQIAQDLASEQAAASVRGAPPADTQAPMLAADTVLSLLTAFRRLGFHPVTPVTALLVPLVHQIPTASSSSLSQLLSVLSELRHDPGPSLAQGIVKEVHRRWQQGAAGALELADAYVASVTLGHSCSDGLVEDVCRACLYQDEVDDSGATAAPAAPEPVATGAPHTAHTRFLTSLPSPGLTCQLLAALVATDQVTIRRLGMACVALRDCVGRVATDSWMPVAAAATVLGEEGWEMAEQVLPGDAVVAMRQALQTYLTRWSQSLPDLLAWQDAQQTVREAMGAVGCVPEDTQPALQVQGCVAPLPVHRVLWPPATEPTLAEPSGNSQGSAAAGVEAAAARGLQEFQVVVEPLASHDVAVNLPWRVLGAARFRQQLLDTLMAQEAWAGDARRLLMLQVGWVGYLQTLPPPQRTQRLVQLTRDVLRQGCR